MTKDKGEPSITPSPFPLPEPTPVHPNPWPGMPIRCVGNTHPGIDLCPPSQFPSQYWGFASDLGKLIGGSDGGFNGGGLGSQIPGNNIGLWASFTIGVTIDPVFETGFAWVKWLALRAYEETLWYEWTWSEPPISGTASLRNESEIQSPGTAGVDETFSVVIRQSNSSGIVIFQATAIDVRVVVPPS